MPRKKADDEPIDAAETAADAEYQTLREVYEGIGSPDVRVTVYRLTETGLKEFCCNGGAAIDEAYIQSKFGGGKYALQFRTESGHYSGHKTITIAAPVAADPPAVSTSSQGAAGGDLRFQLLTDQMNRQQELLLRLIESKNGGGEKNDLVKVIEAVAALRELGGDPQSHIQGTVQALMEGIKLGARGNGNGHAARSGDDKFSNILNIVDRVGEILPRVIGPVAAAFSRPAGSPPDPPPGPDASRSIGAAAPGSPPDPAADPRALALLRQAIAYLKTKIGKDPGVYADWIASNLEESQWYLVARLLAEPYDSIVAKIGDPDLAREPYRPWFESLIDEVRNAIDLDTGRPPGNGGDASDNGEPGSRIGE